jgi:dTMP kinase
MSSGRFITLEGIEGAGKSTVIQSLETALVERGIGVRRTREPGGTPLAETLRTQLLARHAEPMTPLAETLLMFAARSVHVENLIRPVLARGEWVLCDRFSDASRAYQGAGRGVSAQLIEALVAATHPGLVPDRTLLFDLPIELGMGRAKRRAADGDRFEDEDRRFFERVRAAYLALARAEPQRFRLIDASAPLPTVQRLAWDAIVDLM